MIPSPGELPVAMHDPEVLRVAHVDQAVVAAPAIRVDDGLQANAAADDGPKRLSRAIRDDFSVHAAAALKDAEDDRLAAGAAAGLSTDATGSEVRLVELDLAGGLASEVGSLTVLGEAVADSAVEIVDTASGKAGEDGGMGGGQVEGEAPRELAETLLRNA